MGEIVKEVKKAEKVAKDFLEGKLEDGKLDIPNPTPEQMDIMKRIVIAINGTMPLEDLLIKTKEVLKDQDFHHPEKRTILRWMLAVAINRSLSTADKLSGIVAQVNPNPGNGMHVNY